MLSPASSPPAVHGDDAGVRQAGAETRLPSCLHPFVPSLWTCSVLFQLMSTAGTLARCSEFNEKPSRRRFSSLFSLFKHKLGHIFITLSHHGCEEISQNAVL